MKRRPLIERIDEVLARAGGSMTFYELAEALYPPGRAWRCATQGGPPGCYMAVSAALRRGSFNVIFNGDPGPGGRIVVARR